MKERISKYKGKIIDYFKEMWSEKVRRVTVIMFFSLPLLTNIVIETLNKRSFFKCLKSMIIYFDVFLVNYLIILVTLSIALLVKNRIPLISLISAVWIGMGIANFIIKSNRETPFSASDLRDFGSVSDIIEKYVSVMMGAVIVGAIILAATGIAYMWAKIPNYAKKINYFRNIVIIVCIWFSMLGVVSAEISLDRVSTKFPNMTIAYRDFGFVYCFANSVVNVGVKKPDSYTEDNIAKIKKKLEETITVDEDKVSTPNIIFVQLESFIDVSKIIGLELSQDATPTFNRLKEEFPSGFLTVNNVGYGTANTEFEVMTGMNLEDFGPGEFPYKTVLKTKTCESMAYILREYGYSAHAMHNNTGSFYYRNSVFKNLGFDTYTSLEYMYPTQKTPRGWVKDSILTEEIIKVLDSTDEPDYLYAISVQGHGSYPTDKEIENPLISVSGIDDDERAYKFEYYVNQIYEMDQFIEELTNTLSEYDEEVILVLYGDHLPSLELTEEEITNGDLYQTEYVIWSNFGFEVESKDLETYELGSRILQKLNIDGGVINKFHQVYQNDKDYLKLLKTLEYDILYDNMKIYDGVTRYVPTDMQMGTYEIKISNVLPEESADTLKYQVLKIKEKLLRDELEDKGEKIPENLDVTYDPVGDKEIIDGIEEVENGWYIVKGENFTSYSHVFVNDDMCDTQYIDKNTLRFRQEDMQSLDSIVVKQMWKKKTVISNTKEFLYISIGTEE